MIIILNDNKLIENCSQSFSIFSWLKCERRLFDNYIDQFKGIRTICLLIVIARSILSVESPSLYIDT